MTPPVLPILSSHLPKLARFRPSAAEEEEEGEGLLQVEAGPHHLHPRDGVREGGRTGGVAVGGRHPYEEEEGGLSQG